MIYLPGAAALTVDAFDPVDIVHVAGGTVTTFDVTAERQLRHHDFSVRPVGGGWCVACDVFDGSKLDPVSLFIPPPLSLASLCANDTVRRTSGLWT